MALPLIAIVGRPNVGKSSLLNMLAGRRISIVEPTAGVTRDRIQTLCEHDGHFFEVVDTGGYGIVDRDDLGEQVERQIRLAVEQADAVLFVVDGREGLNPLDQAVAKWLRPVGKPVLLLANKADAMNTPLDLGELPALGFGEPLPVSATHRRGDDEILAWIMQHLPESSEPPPEPVMKVALVGRRNAGKSSLINALAGADRVIVSEIPGTTRDAVDVRFEYNGRTFTAIDTAGLRKKSKLADDIEYYSFHRAELSVRRADVVLFLLDATLEVGTVDKKLGSYIVEQHKPCIIVVNKWDLAKAAVQTGDFAPYLADRLPGLEYAPIAFTTARDGKNVHAVIDLATALFKQARTRVGTGELNTVLREIMDTNPPKPRRGEGKLKILYGTQIAVCPPTLVLFTNEPSRATPAVERFLLARLRERLPFAEVPIRLIYRGRRGMKGLAHMGETAGDGS